MNPEKKSFREFINPYLEPVPWTKFGINVLLGPPADRIPNGPQTLFLPDLLKERFADARMQRADTSLSLVAGQNVYVPANPATFTTPFIAPAVAFWLLLGLVVPLSFIFHSRKTFWCWFERFLFGSVGLLGLIILFLWLFSSYPSTKWNWNIVWSAPALLTFIFSFTDIKQFSGSYKAFLVIYTAIIILFLLSWSIIPQQIPYVILPILLLLGFQSIKKQSESLNTE